MSEEKVYVAKDDDGNVVAMSVIDSEAAHTIKGWIENGMEVDQMVKSEATEAFIGGRA